MHAAPFVCAAAGDAGLIAAATSPANRSFRFTDFFLSERDLPVPDA
jgi:hypothetical protein